QNPMTRCWGFLLQVQRFLESSWNDSDVVPRFCSVYVDLRRAMEELFGQQTVFLLSLRQGFCEGLLQLSFLTTLHLTERFARYIDQRVQEIRSDSSDFRAMDQLQQFLEFVLFLSDLELTNTFEHFYRHYLADRLLSLGPCWLENYVVEHIGICFPNHFPQQMLKNLQEAKDLQREQHLYSLQEVDSGLLSEEDEESEVRRGGRGTASGGVSVPHSVLVEEDEEDLDVQISVLSPRCWAVSSLCYMNDPSKHLPESLGARLQRFTDFYMKSQSTPGSELSQCRRLQWTWLGNAELQYGDLTVRVSTLQMFILLLFNQQEEISEEFLLQSTGMSSPLLSHALTPLTAKDSILRHNQNGETEILIKKPPGNVLQLRPKQTYLNVEEDEGRSLERKRNVLLCLITRIMKMEKEIHIDNLVYVCALCSELWILSQVIDACKKLELKESLPSLGLGCSHTDVLSCVMHLLSLGYVRRGEDSQHILEYLCTEPSTPHKEKHIITLATGIYGIFQHPFHSFGSVLFPASAPQSQSTSLLLPLSLLYEVISVGM
uniref:Cullin family profile domain-containing protein n=1 Tax=Leptobrachium leishanense TaxID=445787 RepID=A0A8C5QAV7_9ANUR